MRDKKKAKVLTGMALLGMGPALGSQMPESLHGEAPGDSFLSTGSEWDASRMFSETPNADATLGDSAVWYDASLTKLASADFVRLDRRTAGSSGGGAGGGPPDLVPTWQRLSQRCRTKKGTISCKLKGTLLVENPGTGDAAASQVSFYLSADGDLDSIEHPPELLGQASLKAVRPGKRRKAKLKLTLPPGQSASSMYIIGVVDSTNVVTETNEDNNVAVFGPVL